MSSDAIVTVRMGSQDSAQMHLAEDNDVVQALTSDRSDQPFYTAVETGRTASSAAPLAPADRDRTYKMVAPWRTRY